MPLSSAWPGISAIPWARGPSLGRSPKPTAPWARSRSSPRRELSCTCLEFATPASSPGLPRRCAGLSSATSRETAYPARLFRRSEIFQDLREPPRESLPVSGGRHSVEVESGCHRGSRVGQIGRPIVWPQTGHLQRPADSAGVDQRLAPRADNDTSDKLDLFATSSFGVSAPCAGDRAGGTCSRTTAWTKRRPSGFPAES